MTRFPVCCLAALAVGLAVSPAGGGEPTFRGRTAREWLCRIQDQDGTFSTEVIDNLAEMGPEAKIAIPFLVRALRSPDREVRDHAARALANIGPEARVAIPVLIAVLREPGIVDPDGRMVALALFGDAALAPLLEALEEDDADVRGCAAQALAWMGEKAEAPVVKRLRHKKPEVREAAADILQQMGAEAQGAVPALLNTLKDPAREVRRSAVIALFSIDPGWKGTAREIVKALIASKDYDLLLFVARAIDPDAGAKELVPTLIPLLDSENDLLFTVACGFLGQIGPGAEAAVPALGKQLLRGKTERASDAARTLLSLGPKGRAAWRAALRHPHFDVAFDAALAAVGEPGVDDALLLPVLLEGLKHKDSETQQQAAVGLGCVAARSCPRNPRRAGDIILASGGALLPRLPDPAHLATTALMDVLRQHKGAEVRRVAADELGAVRVQSEAVVRGLIGAMRDPDTKVRLEAVRSLGRIGPPARAALPQLREFARRGEGEELWAEALSAEAQITCDWRKFGPLLLRLEREGGHGDHFYSVIRLLATAEAPVDGFLVNLLQSRERDRRQLALRILGCPWVSVSEQLIPALVEVLGDKDPALRRQAARALGWLGSRAAVGPLCAALEDEDGKVRGEVAYALARIGPAASAAVPGLLPMLEAKDRVQRGLAVYALARIGAHGKKAPPMLIAALDEEELRGYAVVALARMGPEARPAVPRLVAALEDKDPLVRCGAAWALGNVGPEAAPAVQALVMMLHSPHELLQASAARALGRIGPRARAAVPALRALSTDPRIAVRRRILGGVPGLSVTGRDPLSTLLPEEGLDAYAEAKKALAKIEPEGTEGRR